MASTVAAGDIYGEGTLVVYLAKESGAIAKGDVLRFNSTGVAVAGTSSKGPFFVAEAAAATGDSVVKAVAFGQVYVTADGTIKTHERVMMSTATAAQVVAYVASTIDTTPTQSDVQEARDEFKLIVGVYMGQVDEGAPSPSTAVPSNAADGELARIFVGKLN